MASFHSEPEKLYLAPSVPEIIPELLQSDCNANNIFETVCDFMENPDKIKSQIDKTNIILKKLKTDKSSGELAAKSIIRTLQN